VEYIRNKKWLVCRFQSGWIGCIFLYDQYSTQATF